MVILFYLFIFVEASDNEDNDENENAEVIEISDDSASVLDATKNYPCNRSNIRPSLSNYNKMEPSTNIDSGEEFTSIPQDFSDSLSRR